MTAKKKILKLPEFHAHYKLWLSLKNGDGILGDGKWQLLLAIHKFGSISKAATVLDISYRKAWGDIRKVESMLGINIVEKTRGGAVGGCTILTSKGEMLVKAFSKFHLDFEKLFKGLSKEFELQVKR